MAKSHKGQHWVPRSYLEAWVDPERPPNYSPFVHVFDKEGKKVRQKSPKNIFKETDLYTIQSPDGGRDLTLEHGLAGLETSFDKLRREFLERRRPLPSVRWAKLLLFVAALHVRTPMMRDHHGRQWREVYDTMKELEDRMKTATPEEKKRAAFPKHIGNDNNSMSMDEVQKFADNPMQELLRPFIAAEAPLLAKLQARVFCTDNVLGFITSDSPVVWFDPEWHKKPPLYQSPSFSDPMLEITMPISPDQLLILSHGEPGFDYIDVSDDVVTELNRRTRFSCQNEFVVQKNLTQSRWFERGEEPEDSWENLHNNKGKP